MNLKVTPGAPAQLVLFAALAAVFLYLPLMALTLLCVFAAWGTDRNWRWAFLLAVCILFGTLNAVKQVDGDLANYVNLQNYLSGRPFLALLDIREMRPISPTYRTTEIGFYGVQWVLAQICGSASASLAIVATLTVYGTTFAGILLLARVEAWNNRLTIIVALVAFFAAINFNNTTHLMRQYVSASFAFLALAALLNRRTISATVWALVSCSVHNATAYLFASFILIAALFPYGRRFWDRPWGSAWRVLVALCVLGGSVGLLWLQQAATSGLLENSDVNVVHYLFASTIFALFWCGARSRGANRNDYYLGLAFLVTFFISGFFFALHIRITALRYFIYLEWLYAPMVAVMLCAIPRRYIGAYLGSRWLVCCAAICVFFLRMNVTGWNYGPDSQRVLSISARELVEYVGT
jgi:hypothetical protein